MSGDPNTGNEVFQPFDVDADVTLERIDLDGWTIGYHPDGFRATIFPDDGTGTFPDEGALIEWIDFQWRFSGGTTVWVGRPVGSVLSPGRYWVRLTVNHEDYDAAAHVGTSGPASLSRRNSNGQISQASRSVAMRIAAAEPAAVGGGECRGARCDVAGGAESVSWWV